MKRHEGFENYLHLVAKLDPAQVFKDLKKLSLGNLHVGAHFTEVIDATDKAIQRGGWGKIRLPNELIAPSGGVVYAIYDNTIWFLRHSQADYLSKLDYPITLKDET